jgi:hypothetical protein
MTCPKTHTQKAFAPKKSIVVRTSVVAGAKTIHLAFRATDVDGPQLYQNYMTLCVRIGKIDRLRTPLNA